MDVLGKVRRRLIGSPAAPADDEKLLRCQFSTNRYGGYCVPISSLHRPAAKAILAGDVWEPDTLAFMRARCGDGDIVHAGTYFGDFLPALAKAVSPDARIWAFEPNRENYRCAKITVELNALDNVILANAGLGAQSETLAIKTRDQAGRSLGGSSQIVGATDEDNDQCQKVGIVTIDDVIPSDRHVSIVQLDVEGHEKEALIGALRTIRRCRPILIVELWRSSPLLTGSWFAENIETLGYKKLSQIHDNSVFMLPADRDH